MKKKILIRADGTNIAQLGMGHLVRCFHLANELARQKDTSVVFLTRGYPDAVKWLKPGKFKTRIFPKDGREDAATLKAIVDFQPDIVVIDSIKIDPDYLALIKKTGVVLISIENIGPGGEIVDFSINPILTTGKKTYEGYEYMMLSPISNKNRAKTKQKSKPRVFVSFGGYDHNDITKKFLYSVDVKNGVQYDIVVTGLYKNFSALKKKFSRNKNVQLHQNTNKFFDLMAGADVAVTSGGLTMFQAAAAGVPSLIIPQYDHQNESAAKMERLGAVKNIGPAKPSNLKNIDVEIKSLLNKPHLREQMAETGKLLIDGMGIKRVAQLVGIVDRQQWDSKFFGINIAYLYPKVVREAVMKFALRKCVEDKIDCLYYLCNCHDPESVRLVEKYGFHFVDIRLTFSMRVPKNSNPSQHYQSTVFNIRKASKKDIPTLSRIAAESYVHSRYFFDKHFPIELCRKFYSDWIAKSVTGGFDDLVFVSELNGKIAGYVSCVKTAPNRAKIGLVGIDKQYQGQGVGKTLITHALKWAAENSLPLIEVVTQGRNVFAQRLYQSCGFKTDKTELWYHKWFNLKGQDGKKREVVK